MALERVAVLEEELEMSNQEVGPRRGGCYWAPNGVGLILASGSVGGRTRAEDQWGWTMERSSEVPKGCEENCLVKVRLG